MPWMVRLRAHDGGEILERASFGSPSAAMDAYRLLLRREDLIGEPLTAVFKPPRGATGSDGNTSNWFSRFDRELGQGRIGPDDPRLDPFANSNDAYGAVNSPAPKPPAPVDWEADGRPFAEVLKDWARTRGGRNAAAAVRRVGRKTFDGWCGGRGAAQEAMARRLMTLADRSGSR
ncbi:hypothetical protein AO398_00680 [Methylobacterium sp. GXS13]|uniref:hypothetical protein n=1 Tax=Methylobacterium sp. GXS13 TaxID=1730094 RepID=UPI00071B9445|nr:hypothetical protein [Methylobacterium sp. GXS13]KST61234.1 hypothetical protein AO398_00680 [Methylobacterium sp. GXS13]